MQGTQRPRHESESETQLDHGGEAAEAQRENRMQEDARDTGDHSTDVQVSASVSVKEGSDGKACVPRGRGMLLLAWGLTC